MIIVMGRNTTRASVEAITEGRARENLLPFVRKKRPEKR